MDTVPATEIRAAHPNPAGLRPSVGFDHPIVISVENLRKDYITGRGRLALFDGLGFEVVQGEMQMCLNGLVNPRRGLLRSTAWRTEHPNLMS